MADMQMGKSPCRHGCRHINLKSVTFNCVLFPLFSLHIYIHLKINENEDFSWYPIDCDNEAELSIITTYLRIAPLLPPLSTSFAKCAPFAYKDIDDWWARYAPDYYPEIQSAYEITGDIKFNVYHTR